MLERWYKIGVKIKTNHKIHIVGIKKELKNVKKPNKHHKQPGTQTPDKSPPPANVYRSQSKRGKSCEERKNGRLREILG